MKMTRILTPLALAVSATLGTQQVLAGPSGYEPVGPPKLYHAGTAVVRLGGSYVDPDNTNASLRNPDIFPEFVVDGRRGFDFDLDSEWSWQFSAMFMPFDHFSVEYMYVGESSHDTDIRVDNFVNDGFRRNFRLNDLDRTTNVLTVNWFPVCPESWVQPYVGIGTHYTDFDSVRVREPVNEALAVVGDAVGPARLSVGSSWGWVGQVGIDILFGRDSNWLVNASAIYLDMDLTADLDYAVRGLTNDDEERLFYNSVRTKFDPDPWLWNIGIGYKF
ncbi:OmpW family protein [Microbulbifer sp. 2201CG32-9]|uniref:OmpW/AlkL family protein n=1 Tax=unclassified Microbulbifer TaxID=2619833 RepID=UPI00345B5678